MKNLVINTINELIKYKKMGEWKFESSLDEMSNKNLLEVLLFIHSQKFILEYQELENKKPYDRDVIDQKIKKLKDIGIIITC